MARSVAAPDRLRPKDAGDRSSIAHLGGRRMSGVRMIVLAIVLVSLIGFVIVALVRELGDGSRSTAARAASTRPVVATPRPALTGDEEAYAQALWPIHNEVKASALKMSMAGIQYKIGRLDVAGLKAEIESSHDTYRRAEGQIRELHPPTSLQPAHDDYLNAVVLYQQAATEMVRVYDDHSDDHLLTAFPMSQEGGRALRRVGAVLWPSEYVPS